MRIRPACPADVAAMHALRLGVSENRLSDPQLVTEQSYAAYLGQGAAWVAEDERGLAGFAIVDLAAAIVWALFVAPQAQGEGVGRALHARLLESAMAAGLERLRLTTAPGTRAERFYAEAGWTGTGTTRTGELSFEKKLFS